MAVSFLFKVFLGHTSGIRHLTFFENDKLMLSLSDDKTMRLWDRRSGQEIKKLEFPSLASSMEVSRDATVITTTHSNIVTFWDSKE